MARWVEEDTDFGLWLVSGEFSAEADRVGHCCVQIGHLEVEVEHHLRPARFGRPHRART